MVEAGWYPDPAGSPDERWWDGTRWSPQTRPSTVRTGYPAPTATQPGPDYSTPSVYGQPVYSHGGYQSGGPSPYGFPAGQPQLSFYRRNRYSVMALGFAFLYLVLAFGAHFVVIGIVPVLMAFRAFRARERMAPLAAVAAGLAILIGLLSLVG